MSEVNMIQAIQPKSDQINFDDFLGGQTRTIKITKVSGSDGEQKVIINYEGDNGKPYKPGKSMCRVLVALWGDKGSAYVGRSLTLYGDPEVVFGGVKVGGIRISNMSHIDEPHVLQLTNKRGGKKSFTVRPLKAEAKPAPTKPVAESAPEKPKNDWAKWGKDFVTDMSDLDADALNDLINKESANLDLMKTEAPKTRQLLDTRISERLKRLDDGEPEIDATPAE